MKQQFYSAITHSDEVWKKSSSGGAFTAISDAWFDAHGTKAVVYGCALTEDMYARHIRGENPDARNKMRGAKYVASDMVGVYPQVEKDLEDGRFVLFSGTPCQIAALNRYLSVKRKQVSDSLLTLEVVCHGVGSNRFFQDYLQDQEKRWQSKVVECSFRGKSRPSKIQEMKLTFQNGSQHVSPAAKYDWFYTAYLGNYILRPACCDCQFATKDRVADISIADHWGADAPRAKSLLIANSPLGEAWIEVAGKSMYMEMIEEGVVYVPNMVAPSKKPMDYEQFWECYLQGGYMAVQAWLGNNTALGRCKATLASVLYYLHLTEVLKRIKHMGKKMLTSMR